MPACKHAQLHFDVSEHAIDAGYKQPSAQQRLAATQLSGRAPSATKSRPGSTSDIPPLTSTFPAPLVLPDDELSRDPKYPAQSVRSWKSLVDSHARDPAKHARRTVYVVPPPEIADGAKQLRTWTEPRAKGTVTRPAMDDIVAYLTAFYHGLPVKVLEDPKLRFNNWEDDKKLGKSAAPPVALETGSEAVRITTRHYDKDFAGQLNLNDLLDAAISILPDDAFALLMIVHHDLYEDEEDDFCCGRAYGGSGVAVVSTARYHPSLDKKHLIDRTHAWPASHCKQYMEKQCAANEDVKRPTKRKKVAYDDDEALTSMHAALAAHNANAQPEPGSKESDRWLEALWLGRVCKTASHELGHCFGADHCIYYACVMQGTAGLPEDARQPPYLCPVDTAKILGATGAGEVERNQALLAFCERYADDALFTAFAAWLQVRLQELRI